MLTSQAIAVDGLVKRFGDVVAVADVSFRVERGTIFGLLGRNGAGKSTTLACCIGLERPTAGSVRVDGRDPSRAADFRALRRTIGVQLQATSLPEKATAGEVLTLYAAYYGIRARSAELAERVGLADKLDRRIAVMSGGEQQRLALALALQHDPHILFLDEPTAGMDAFGRRILWNEVQRLRNEGRTIVLTTHYIEEAEALSDRICMVQHGNVIAEGTPAELVAARGGSATIAVEAPGFAPVDGLASLGTWTQAGRRWTLATPDDPSRALTAIVAHAAANGNPIEALDLRRPTLEDAFLAITGEDLETESA